jgi:hypothetical protein
MKLKWFPLTLISLLSFSLALGTDGILAQNKKPVPQRVNPNSSSYSFEDYKKECLVRAGREGLGPDVAEELCNCTINNFRSHYSIQQFRALVQKSKTDKVSARTLSDVGEACFDEVLYEK